MSSLSTPLWWQLYAFGSASAMCGELASFPMDLAKTRRQLPGGVGLRELPSLLRAGGLRAVYAGLSAALLRQATYGGLRLGLYERLLRAAEPEASASAGYGGKLAAGSLSGFASALACAPCDVAKVRMQAAAAAAAAARPQRGHVFTTLAAIVRAEGVRGLWVGALPTAARAAVVAAFEIGTYDEAKALLISHGLAPGAPTTHLTAALCAGAAASVAASPIDVIKSRWIVGRARYASLADALAQTLREGGPRALWRGLPGDFARRCPHTVVTYVVLEQLRNVFAAS